MNFWSHLHHPRAAITLLRITLAVLLLFHGWAKITHGVGGIEKMVVSHGLAASLLRVVMWDGFRTPCRPGG